MVCGIDRQTGSLVRLQSGPHGWAVLAGARAARPFDLLMPLPGRRVNRTRDIAQGRPQVAGARSGTAVELRWDSAATGPGAGHDVSVVARYALQGDGLVCTVSIDNRSDLVVENVVFPCLPDLQPPDRGESFGSFTYSYGTARRHRLWPHFDNVVGYFGVDRPTTVQDVHALTVPGSPFVLLEGAGQGLYVGVDEARPELLSFVFELEPGYGESIDSRVPEGAVHRGQGRPPGALPRAHPVRDAGGAPGPACRPAAVLSGVTGMTGASIYRARRRTWMGSSQPPAWAASRTPGSRCR